MGLPHLRCGAHTQTLFGRCSRFSPLFAGGPGRGDCCSWQVMIPQDEPPSSSFSSQPPFPSPQDELAVVWATVGRWCPRRGTFPWAALSRLGLLGWTLLIRHEWEEGFEPWMRMNGTRQAGALGQSLCEVASPGEKDLVAKGP